VGTASLVIGLALILLGFYFIIELMNSDYWILGILVFSVPLIAGGALFLRKYDKDKKKDQNRTN